MLTYTVKAEDHCRRLESYLQRLLPGARPAYIRKLIKSGSGRIDNRISTPDTLIFSGDRIVVKESASVLELLNSPQPLIDLLWQDGSLLVLNKPAGLAMHPAAEVDENLADLVSSWLAERSNHPVRAYPVNRLDRGTSGVVLLATSSSNAGILGRQVKEEGLDKQYLAVVEGVAAVEGEIDRPLDEKESVTRFRTIVTGANCSLLVVEPVTGRTHQIRRHLSMIGHPVAGDKRYNATVLEDLPGIALHSFRTTLKHPSPDCKLTVCAPLPTGLVELIVEHCGTDYKRLLGIIENMAL